MDDLIQLVLKEVPETVTTTLILEYTPRFIQEAQKLLVPGAEKKAAVLNALRTLVDLLLELQKIPTELATELKAFIDITVSTTVDMLIDVSKGRVSLSMPQTVEEVNQKVNCFLQLIRTILSIVKVAKAPAAPAAPATPATPQVVLEIMPEATEAAPNSSEASEGSATRLASCDNH